MRKQYELTDAGVELVMKRYAEEAQTLKQIKYDKKDWDEYEKINKGKNLKLRDMNQRDIFSIKLIKNQW